MNETLTKPAPRHTSILARWHLPTVFAGVFVAFCLPFATVSCNGAETTFTGMQLVTHTVPHGGTFEDEDGNTDEINNRVERRSSITATIALLAAAVGILLALRRRATGWCASIGLSATLFLGVNTGSGFMGGPDVTYRWGYWATLLLFVWACLVHIGRRIRPGWRDWVADP